MAANGFCVQKSCLPARLACKYVANIQDMIRGHRTGADGTKIPPDLDSMRSARHQVTLGNTTVPELQNRCASESSQAGSIPVRLR